MLVKHRCGHEVNIPPRNAWFVKKTLCYDCRQIYSKLFEKQLLTFFKPTKLLGGKQTNKGIIYGNV